MAQVAVKILGAGRHVGKSCTLVALDGTFVLCDCGVQHGGTAPVPDLKSLFRPNGDSYVDAVFITHFHADHIGALPLLTEMCGYSGPVYMTQETWDLGRLSLLEMASRRQVRSDRSISPSCPGADWRLPAGAATAPPALSEDDVVRCFSRAAILRPTASLAASLEISSNETGSNSYVPVRVKDVLVTAYPAGHVPGAAMFEIAGASHRVLYTGDFTSAPEQWLPARNSRVALPPKVATTLITEATYASQVRDLKAAALTDLCLAAQDTLWNRGHILVPCAVLGKSQELAIVLRSFLSRFRAHGEADSPAPGDARFRANKISESKPPYRIVAFGQLAAAAMKLLGVDDFFAVEPAEALQQVRDNAPCPPTVFLAGPKDLGSGPSLEVLKILCDRPDSLILIPGSSPPQTIAHQIVNGAKKVTLPGNGPRSMRCKMRYVPLGAHDDMGELFRFALSASPRATVLVHGTASGMEILAHAIRSASNSPVFVPYNNHSVIIALSPPEAALLEKTQTLEKALLFEWTNRCGLPPNEAVAVVRAFFERSELERKARALLPVGSRGAPPSRKLAREGVLCRPVPVSNVARPAEYFER